MESKIAPHGTHWSRRITSGSSRLRAAVTPFASGQAFLWSLNAKAAPVTLRPPLVSGDLRPCSRLIRVLSGRMK